MNLLSKQAQNIGSCVGFNVNKKDKIPKGLVITVKTNPMSTIFIYIYLNICLQFPPPAPLRFPTLQTTGAVFLRLLWRQSSAILGHQ